MSGKLTTSKSAPTPRPRARLQLQAIGLESEFNFFVNDRQVKVEEVFRDPRSFIRAPLVHRVGGSYHLPTGSAVYFDTGVIELATPVIEIDRGCAARAGRSLWEAILFIRRELDEWERKKKVVTRLVGFSTHYNVSFHQKNARPNSPRTIEKMAHLLAHILPAPVMLLAANRRSTGIGVRPRGDRIEVTADFTPDASLMIATATMVTGIAREVMKWPSFELPTLRQMKIPVIEGFQLTPHNSRQGWLASSTSYSRNPFTADVDEPIWPIQTAGRSAVTELLSLRQMADRIFRIFWRAIARISDPFTFRLIGSVLSRDAPSLLDLKDRPAAYEDVGRLCTWDNLFPRRALARSRYERVLIHAISGDRLRMHGQEYTPAGMRGWAEVVMRRDGDGTRHVFSIDYLLQHLNDWV